MKQSSREKWNKRYKKGAYSARTYPSDLLVKWLPKVQNQSKELHAIDIACGTGRNSIYLAQNGWQVDSLDISEVALSILEKKILKENLSIRCINKDLECTLSRNNGFLVDANYDLVVVIRYTNLSLINNLHRILKPGGYLIVEEHLVTTRKVIGPQNPKYRVAPQALNDASTGLEIISYQEGIVEDPDNRLAALAQLIARKPS
tara:strand:+ start:3406 stop:4014 length:609 start_codon:yes stop_codon:yes gene_type:complete